MKSGFVIRFTIEDLLPRNRGTTPEIGLKNLKQTFSTVSLLIARQEDHLPSSDFDTQLSAKQGDLRVMISTAGRGPGSISKSLPLPLLSVQSVSTWYALFGLFLAGR